MPTCPVSFIVYLLFSFSKKYFESLFATFLVALSWVTFANASNALPAESLFLCNDQLLGLELIAALRLADAGFPFAQLPKVYGALLPTASLNHFVIYLRLRLFFFWILVNGLAALSIMFNPTRLTLASTKARTASPI